MWRLLLVLVQEFFLGSVTNYMSHNCVRPLCILHVD